MNWIRVNVITFADVAKQLRHSTRYGASLETRAQPGVPLAKTFENTR